MSLLTQIVDEHLKRGRYGAQYRWQAAPGDNPKVTGWPDNVMLNRGQGYEMRDFINRFCNKYRISAVQWHDRMETIIHQAYPGPFSHEGMRRIVALNLGLPI